MQHNHPARAWLARSWVSGGTLSFRSPGEKSRLKFIKRWITRENAAPSAREGLAALNADFRNVRVASVDLDGNDGPVVRALLAAGVAPDVFVVEYNAKFPPGIEFEMPYDEGHVGSATTIKAYRCKVGQGFFRQSTRSLPVTKMALTPSLLNQITCNVSAMCRKVSIRFTG